MRIVHERFRGIEAAIPTMHHNESFGARDLAGAADRVDHSLQMVDILDSETDQDVRVAGKGVELLGFGNPPDDVGDLSRFRGTTESHFHECLESAASMLIDHGSIPANDSKPMESINASLHRGSCQIDHTCYIAHGQSPPAAQDLEDLAICSIDYDFHWLKISCASSMNNPKEASLKAQIL